MQNKTDIIQKIQSAESHISTAFDAANGICDLYAEYVDSVDCSYEAVAAALREYLDSDEAMDLSYVTYLQIDHAAETLEAAAQQWQALTK